MFYERMVRPILFGLSADDPEEAHEKVLSLLRWVGEKERLARLIEWFSTIRDRRLGQEVFGLKFPNPVGLAAGFDKNAIALRGLQALGFGFIETGTIARFHQEGNPRPRIFRFPEDKALINRMGFNNDGADKVAERLAKARRLTMPVGISLGKSKITLLEEAANDYLYSLRKLYPCGDYFIVNVSSPNTPGLRQLQEKEYLDTLLFVLQKEGKALAGQSGIQPKPILVKIAPDLSWEAIDELLQICFDRQVAGLIAVNTTIARDGLSVSTKEEGGLSGRPLWPRAINIVRHIYQETKGKLPIIGVGGISGPEEAYQMLRYASLIQVLTGFIYQGPFIARQINRGLKKLMDREGVRHISELRRE